MKTLVAFVGPSCAGKTFLMRLMQKRYGWTEIVSTTTRTMRPEEIYGEAYHFVDEETFLKMKDNNELMEWVEFAGQYYGISKDAFDLALENSEGGIAAVIVNPQGLGMMNDWLKDNGLEDEYKIVSVYINGNPQVLAERMLKRFEYDLCMNGEPNRVNTKHYSHRFVSQADEIRSWPAALEYTLTIVDFNENNTDFVMDLVVTIAMK